MQKSWVVHLSTKSHAAQGTQKHEIWGRESRIVNGTETYLLVLVGLGRKNVLHTDVCYINAHTEHLIVISRTLKDHIHGIHTIHVRIVDEHA